MRIIFGGAYNGKRTFLNNYLKKHHLQTDYVYEGEIPKGKTYSKEDIVVIGTFEKMIQHKMEYTEDEIVNQIIEELEPIEKQASLICICTDIGRGIVPMDQKERKLRDACGRLYQRLFQKSEQIVRIWYGLPQYLKGDEWI